MTRQYVRRVTSLDCLMPFCPDCLSRPCRVSGCLTAAEWERLLYSVMNDKRWVGDRGSRLMLSPVGPYPDRDGAKDWANSPLQTQERNVTAQARFILEMNCTKPSKVSPRVCLQGNGLGTGRVVLFVAVAVHTSVCGSSRPFMSISSVRRGFLF